MEKKSEKCGIFCFHPKFWQKLADVRIFVALMCAVIAVQGTYLGYMVGVLTSIERRFEINSSRTGLLLSMYDVGHTVTVILVGYFGCYSNKPRWTAYGIILSGLAMFGLTLPNFLYGATSRDEDILSHIDTYTNNTYCNPKRQFDRDYVENHPMCDMYEHGGAYGILLVSQLIAGVAAAPFNTLAYVYIDDNVNHRQSPFYLGLLTSMYAFGPALGFMLSAACNTLYANPLEIPNGLDASNPNWVGAWWLGFILCAILYILCAIPMFCFPQKLPKKRMREGVPEHHYEMKPLDTVSQQTENQEITCKENCTYLGEIFKVLPSALWKLLKNPVFTSMMFGWIFGSYLVGGFGTYLPKYIQMQYHQTPARADVFAALISIGSVAVSTAVGGYILTKYDIRPRRASLLLAAAWTLIFATYILGMATGCEQPVLAGSRVGENKWNISESCNANCKCDAVFQFEPICLGNKTYFSPCHAGCQYDHKALAQHTMKWVDCACAEGLEVEAVGNFCDVSCYTLPIYLVIMFIGLFVGNLFFMATMMVVLRCVHDDEKALALSFASCITNLFGFIPGPIVFGSVIDSTCIAWHSLCPNEQGNCIAYDNNQFRHKYHMTSAGFQLAAIVSVLVTYLFSRKFTYPEDEKYEEDVQEAVQQLDFEPRPVVTRSTSS